jgi:altronate dehydratase small subunit
VSRAVLLDPRDDVAVLVEPVDAGANITLVGANGTGSLTAVEALPLGHKVAVRALGEGEPVRKYGEVIGRMTAAASAGDHVHVHNLVSLRS